MLESQNNYLNGKQNIALATVIIIIIGTLADYFSYYETFPKIQTVIVLIGFILYSLSIYLFFSSQRKLYKLSFAISAYTLILNILATPLFFNFLYPSYSNDSFTIFSKDYYAISVILVVSAYILGRVHLIIQFVISLTLIVFYFVFTQSPNLLINIATYLFSLIGVTVVLFFVTKYNDIFINKLNKVNLDTKTLFEQESVKNIKLQKFLNAQVVLAKEETFKTNNSTFSLSQFHTESLLEIYSNVVITIALSMETSRVSIWFFSEEREKIIRQIQFENNKLITQSTELKAVDFPIFFKAINARETILAIDAKHNKNTMEFKESYLDPLNIYSMMDCPIMLDGQIVGVICCEHQNEIANWDAEEIFFIESVTDYISMNIQNHIISNLLGNLKTKTKEIIDSITYAKRIQTAILPSEKIVERYLTNSFILYQPKDIIAGDFYWMEAMGDLIYFAAADCTGHGVPGAMISVICYNALNRSLKEFLLSEPGEILDKTRELVLEQFSKSHEDVKDGMDISLCVLNINTKELKWAGANSPLWLIKNNKLLIEKANKQPIGKCDNMVQFTTHTFQLEHNDTLYIFTDGYADQFGGEKDKKFKTSAMKSMLLQIQDESMIQQKILINKAFEVWKGDVEQVDDVCIIGLRI